MMKKILISDSWVGMCVISKSTTRIDFFTHYSSEDGLSQNTVMSILARSQREYVVCYLGWY